MQTGGGGWAVAETPSRKAGEGGTSPFISGSTTPCCMGPALIGFAAALFGRLSMTPPSS